ncbi:MAG: hypothetical protein ABJA82_09785 [Myxococcales bacterium]
MKSAARIALLSLMGATLSVMVISPVSAQNKAAAGASASGGGDENTTYKAKTVYDFEDDMVEGDLQRPDGELINGLKKTEHSSLIEIRKDFIPEMLKSLEDI